MRIRYFAWLKQRVGRAEEEVVLPNEIATVGQLKAWLAGRYPRFAEACAATGVVKAAVDQEFAEDDRPLAGAREVAFFPPVTGG
ncbi:MAG: molybdopterin converting factor subunit 1 [Geminicoccaceae bacterium]|nr:molybdopterin converting factor subunit 1 [Geminicoccaceae bacterium]MCX8101348.1 molybdopterin converting factor subunit 1 [Geminicoccaceae bacterium]MDW8371365.1 molybdopterin converting factor subunit 1 [Geminicoccaceae bacterium]